MLLMNLSRWLRWLNLWFTFRISSKAQFVFRKGVYLPHMDNGQCKVYIWAFVQRKKYIGPFQTHISIQTKLFFSRHKSKLKLFHFKNVINTASYWDLHAAWFTYVFIRKKRHINLSGPQRIDLLRNSFYAASSNQPLRFLPAQAISYRPVSRWYPASLPVCSLHRWTCSSQISK